MAAANGMQWFVLKVASNREDAVRDALERKIKIEGLNDIIGRVLVPTERSKSVKQGHVRHIERKLYPGYVFVEMFLNKDGTVIERAHFMFRDVQGCGDFIGQRAEKGTQAKPLPMQPKDVDNMLKIIEKGEGGAHVKVEFSKGDQVKIREGPFENFEGAVEEIFPDKGVVRVIVTIFGRSTPLDLEYWQVEKADS